MGFVASVFEFSDWDMCGKIMRQYLEHWFPRFTGESILLKSGCIRGSLI